MTRFFMSSVPKSGTHFMIAFYNRIKLQPHWVEDSTYRLLIQKLYQTEAEDERAELSQQIAPLREEAIEAILGMPENHFVYNHYTYDPILLQAILEAEIPVVFLVRDPRDYVVSLTNHILRRRDHKNHQFFHAMKSDEERYLSIITGVSQKKKSVSPINYIYKKMQGWIKNPRVLTLRFEEIIGPKGGGKREVQYRTFEKLINHIRHPINRDELYRQVDATYNEQSTLFVKGKIGQWREVFSDKVLDAFNSHAGYLLDVLGYSEIEQGKSAESTAFNSEDIKRLRACIENSERDFLQERQINAKKEAQISSLEAQISRLEQESKARLKEIYTLLDKLEFLKKDSLDKLEFLEKDSQARLKEIHKRDEEITRLQQELSLSIGDKILRKIKKIKIKNQ